MKPMPAMPKPASSNPNPAIHGIGALSAMKPMAGCTTDELMACAENERRRRLVRQMPLDDQQRQQRGQKTLVDVVRQMAQRQQRDRAAVDLTPGGSALIGVERVAQSVAEVVDRQRP